MGQRVRLPLLRIETRTSGARHGHADALVMCPTDFDECWHDTHDAVNATRVARRTARVGAPTFGPMTDAFSQPGSYRAACHRCCDRTADAAAMTARSSRAPVIVERMAAASFWAAELFSE
ncbi:hypothetical protein [Burkholderia pseudomallei]|uniref:hypothetical protein n=1 Tax=Burkholderia pseudomallei TaxID=28450 RepID=UPI00057241C8|nr:hypothetical protein [Burkholderia pseudomallei]MBD2918882.1 hypothetical protein [Burkholderia pseudomallei]MBD2998219.1 hypothetical protein [Burkholderia pseudomallei]MBF3550645.1 hypothetical protein [Burkholderia pseudomallei]MBF3895712.1 hypothetical protein [Burkholderia pseudomallei]MXP97255.1 hypothetical protein [Burkholderia pseudomallei]